MSYVDDDDEHRGAGYYWYDFLFLFLCYNNKYKRYAGSRFLSHKVVGVSVTLICSTTKNENEDAPKTVSITWSIHSIESDKMHPTNHTGVQWNNKTSNRINFFFAQLINNFYPTQTHIYEYVPTSYFVVFFCLVFVRIIVFAHGSFTVRKI